jgi:hypothetical protein
VAESRLDCCGRIRRRQNPYRNGSAWSSPRITLHRIESGPRAGEFLFAPATVERVQIFYLVTRHLEPRDKAVVQDGYAIYRSLPGWMIPLRWVRSLPSWLRAPVAGQAVWQWLMLLCPLAISLGILVLVHRWTRRAAEDEVANLVIGDRHALLVAFANEMRLDA